MKKCLSVIAMFLSVAMMLSLCGCAGNASQEKEQATAAQTDAAQADTAQTDSAQTYYERLVSCKEQIEAISDFKPEIVLVLGTGLGGYVETLDVKAKIPYKDIKGWPVSTAPEHAGNLIFAEYQGVKLAIMQGRIHHYEGYSMEEVVLPIRVLHLLGANTAILTNAVGSLNPDFKVGDFVCVKDHISSFAPSPLIGENIDELGDRFVEMTNAYDQELQDTILKIGKEKDIPVHSGVYLQVTGPQFETPTEIKMYRSLGADTIAMSVCDEVIAARHMGMKVCAINAISNMGAGIEEEGFTQEMIEDNMADNLKRFTVLMNELLSKFSK